MTVTDIFQQTTISKTEIDIIIEVFSQPVVVKYLKTIAQNDLLELATLSITERADNEVAKKHALIQGKLSTIATLLSISNQPQAKE
jgi:hypothetical protein